MTTRTLPRIHPDWLPPTPNPAPSALPHIHPSLAVADAASPLPRTREELEVGADPTDLAALADREDRELRAMPPASTDARSTQLDHTAYPLRHRIYALYCEGRTFTAIARTLRLDRGTVARHVHAIEATLLAEQAPTSLAHLRLRAVEAQHAILAAAWDALKFEEAQERDYEQQRETDRVQDGHYTPLPGRSRRAQLLAIAARAARTAAQLEGLFTPAALQAALAASCGMLTSATTASPAPSLALEDYPRNSIAGLPPTTPLAPADPTASTASTAASCGMLASVGGPAALAVAPTPSIGAGLPVAFNSTAGSPTTIPAIAGLADHAQHGITPRIEFAGASSTTPLAIAGLAAAAASGSPLPRTGERLGVGTPPLTFR